MALASYGKPVYLDAFRKMIKIYDKGQYKIKGTDFEKVFGKRRLKNEPFEQKQFDIAHSVQKALEETVLQLAGWLYKKTGSENLCLAGGVALNCVLNAALRDNTQFKNIRVQPAAGDAGTALGAALWIDAQQKQNNYKRIEMEHAYWGPDYNDAETEEFLHWTKVPYKS